jgi:CRP-like cAMP-binding protein
MNTEPLIAYISKFIELSDEEIQILLSKIKYRKYKKGQYLLQQEDICNYNTYILSGCTKTYHLDQEGNEHIIHFCVEDWWSADLGSFVSQEPADYNIQCIEDTEVLQFSYANQEELFREIPKLERLFRKMIERALVAAQKRIIRNFSMTAKERYQYFKSQYPSIEQRIPQYMIASYLGITKEFLSKIKSQLILEQ